MIYEHQQVLVRQGGWDQFVGLLHSQVWPLLEEQGASVVGLWRGYLGTSGDTAVLITGYRDLPGWEAAHVSFREPRRPVGVSDASWQGLDEALRRYGELVQEEALRLMEPSRFRPGADGPRPEDRRPVYVHRTFLVKPGTWEEFQRLSHDYIWRSMEMAGCHIVGLWRGLAGMPPEEVLLVTGYHSLAHWERTRVLMGQPPPENVPDEVWRAQREAAQRRLELVERTWGVAMVPSTYRP
ncbi:MAG: hypothetical protein HY683_07945 [Chloroflexi bacterium]|nr:hypothetical protein [Chloroflexota bacterium]